MVLEKSLRCGQALSASAYLLREEDQVTDFSRCATPATLIQNFLVSYMQENVQVDCATQREKVLIKIAEASTYIKLKRLTRILVDKLGDRTSDPSM